MKLFRNKKVEDLNEKIESLQDRLELLEYELRHPQPFKIGDRFDKDNIVTGVQLKRVSVVYLLDLYSNPIRWEIETTNKKSGEKQIIHKR